MKNDCGENYADEEDNHDNGDSYYVYGGINLSMVLNCQNLL